VVDPAAADRTLRLFADRGLASWVLGQVSTPDGSVAGDVVQGTKGVDGGSVRLVGEYRA